MNPGKINLGVKNDICYTLYARKEFLSCNSRFLQATVPQ